MSPMVNVAIPSNRVNVSYEGYFGEPCPECGHRRNPLKSGQCFLCGRLPKKNYTRESFSRNPLKSGQCFLHEVDLENEDPYEIGRNPLKSGQCFLRR